MNTAVIDYISHSTPRRELLIIDLPFTESQ